MDHIGSSDLARKDIIFFSSQHPRDDSDKLIPLESVIGDKRRIGIAIIIQSHNTQLAGEDYIILYILRFVADIIKDTFLGGIGFEFEYFESKLRDHLCSIFSE